MEDSKSDPNYMESLARGLAVLRAFERRPELKVTTAAELTGLSRTSARRCLHTLEKLHYVSLQDGAYRLAATALPLGYAFLGANPLATAAIPVVNDLRDRFHESVSLAVLDDADMGRVIYVARAETSRIISVPLTPGSTLPSYCTSIGRVLLAHVTAEEQEMFLRRAPFPARTPNTLITAEALRSEFQQVAIQGYAMIDEELEPGLRSCAVAVRDRAGAVVAAINMGVSSHRWTSEALRDVIPELRLAAAHLARVV